MRISNFINDWIWHKKLVNIEYKFVLAFANHLNDGAFHLHKYHYKIMGHEACSIAKRWASIEKTKHKLGKYIEHYQTNLEQILDPIKMNRARAWGEHTKKKSKNENNLSWQVNKSWNGKHGKRSQNGCSVIFWLRSSLRAKRRQYTKRYMYGMITTITTKIQMNYDEWTPQLQWHPNRYSVHLSQHVLLLCIRTNNFSLLFCMEMILLRVAATCFCKQPQNSTIKKRTNRFHVILIFMFFLGYKGNVVIVVSR